MTANPDTPAAAVDYSPHRRTALVLVGTGTAGAYHAGVVKALRETGVRIDVVAGRGMGAASALFTAVDADARLWDADGVWTGANSGPEGMYRWRWPWALTGWGAVVAAAGLALPAAAAVALGLLYPLVYLVFLVAPDVGRAWVDRYGAAIAWLLSPDMLLGVMPRAVAAGVLLIFVALALALAAEAWRQRAGRRAVGGAWWRALGAPLEARSVARRMLDAFWGYMRGAANVPQPAALDLSQRYSDLLRESVGQPGYRELVLLAHDLDARRDLVFALLGEQARAGFVEPRAATEQRDRDVVDLAGAGRAHVVDALTAALSISPASEPHVIAFSPEGPWRGERHRLTDRVAATVRLMDEVARAGARQAILVSADAPAGGPHGLMPRRLDPRARLGEAIASAEAAAVRDAADAYSAWFDGVFLIRPGHNTIGPFDFRGAYDQASDRAVPLADLVARGYEDAHRQFIDPVVGASGDTLAAGVSRGGDLPPPSTRAFRAQ